MTDLADQTRRRGDPRLFAGIGFVVAYVLAVIPVAGGFPRPTTPPELMAGYFAGHHTEVVLNGFAQVVAGIALLVFSAGLARTFSGRASAQLIGAGTLAAGTLLLTAVLTNTLTLPVLADQPVLTAVLYHLVFMTGGPAHVVALAALVGTTSVAGWHSGRLPRWLSISGFVIAVLGLLAALNFAVPVALVGPFIPLGRFPAFLFIVATVVVLRRTPHRG